MQDFYTAYESSPYMRTLFHDSEENQGSNQPKNSHDELFEGETFKGKHRMPVQDTSASPYRFICRVKPFFENPDYGPDRNKWIEGIGSGVLIGPGLVLTAAHTVKDRIEYSPGRKKLLTAKRIEIYPGRDGQNMPFGMVEAKTWKSCSLWRYGAKNDHNFDFCLIQLKSRIGWKKFNALNGKPLGWWGSKKWGANTVLKRVNPAYLRKNKVYCSGYPGDKCGHKPKEGSLTRSHLKVCKEKTKQLYATSQWKGDGNVKKIDWKLRYFLHDAPTKKGNSGSPVWTTYKGRFYLAGIHSRSVGVTQNRKKSKLNLAVRLTREMICQLDKMRKAFGEPEFDWYPYSQSDCAKFMYEAPHSENESMGHEVKKSTCKCGQCS